MLGRESAAFPSVVARREIPWDKLARAIRFVAPKLKRAERLIRLRRPPPFQSTKRVAGLAILLLGLTMILKVPFGQLLPALAAMILALAHLEKDGVCLAVALIAALVSIAVSATTMWGVAETID